MSDLGGLYHIKQCALVVNTGSGDVTHTYELDQLKIIAKPVGDSWQTVPNYSIENNIEGVRINFTLAAAYFEPYDSTSEDAIDLLIDALNNATITLYPDASLNPSGGVSVVLDMGQTFQLENIKQGTRDLSRSLSFQSKEIVAPSTLTFYRTI